MSKATESKVEQETPSKKWEPPVNYVPERQIGRASRRERV